MWVSIYSLTQDPTNDRVGHVGRQESLIDQEVPRGDLVLADKKEQSDKGLTSGRIIKSCASLCAYETAAQST